MVLKATDADGYPINLVVPRRAAGVDPLMEMLKATKAAVASEFNGDWNQWLFTKNATTGEMKIYLNGALWHSDTGLTKTMGGITFTGYGCGDGLSYDGMIDDVKFYARD